MITVPITCAVAVLAFTAPATAAQLSTGDRIVHAAAAQAGKPYRSGGTGPGGFDCSGLAQYAHKQVGITLPRTARAQRTAVRGVSKPDKRPGDLVFFASGGKVYHVGIYAGDNKIWAAPESGDVVRLQTIWTSSYTVGRAW
ncbi:C40 family peptidase [Amycolatopsis granulosa]|uniref:C40 family peptidase n=1 Tax=Amycolatopsis granulosa TaxID=185684 RepID=UPI00141EE1CD|nr:C40 family peptidase [Amycolatopsis granulosa]NIH84506.1 cell wall-associated NlpC family hydrolase [Amycolatopsis granulosa]